MPQYMLLLHDAGSFPADMSAEDMQAVIQRYVAWRKQVEAGGRKVSGHKLVDGQGRVMRGQGGVTKVTDGPYAEAREVIGGLFVIDAKDYDEAVTLCRDCPHLEYGSIEIRQIEPTP
jgi:hypothetical protein